MDAPVRIDKWLWAARMFKTRALAAEAVKGGRVKVGGQATKPSRDVKPGDRLEVTVGQIRFDLHVRATAERRGSASAAALLYEETEESRETRARNAELRRLAGASGLDQGARPTKRDRRRYDRARRG